jgi:antitoxin (DNA-binding transcriptional repressor) of toxin-antitoxin stability system
MSQTLSLSDAQSHLPELVEGMAAGDELVLTSNGQTVAVVTRTARVSWPCQPGSAQGRTFWMAPDFDAPLEDFKEYME